MSTRSASLVDLPNSVAHSSAPNSLQAAATDNPRLLRLMKSLYQADQQVKYLHLQAEVESLLQQLQVLKQQRLASGFTEAKDQE